MLLTCDGSLGSPIVYSLILHTRQTLMTAINRRRRDGGPVRDQPSQQWFIGLTIVRAGLLVHRPTLMWSTREHVPPLLLTCDGSCGSSIVYSLILHTCQTLMIAINGRWHDGGPVRDQPSQQWFIGLTTVRAGLLVHTLMSIATHFSLCFDSHRIILSSSVYNDIFQQFESPLQIL